MIVRRIFSRRAAVSSSPDGVEGARQRNLGRDAEITSLRHALAERERRLAAMTRIAKMAVDTITKARNLIASGHAVRAYLLLSAIDDVAVGTSAAAAPDPRQTR